ncbi:aldo/keto reductase [Streptomyces sp. NPDC002209]|uniref:aldo/keto reductase n=1 Tax=Streptomyces sp. NPDC002209 TaxID=3364638 RepID=UPI0036BB9F72
MRTSLMGPTGWAVPAQGLGCMQMGDPADEAEATAVIHRALDLGVTFLDTADMYGRGSSERLVGRALRGRRDRALLCTKFGIVRGAGDSWTIRGDAAYVQRSCEASLTRLRTDVIDLYYAHRLDPKVPIEETVGAMADLVRAGKVRHLGLSEVTGDELRAAQTVHPITAVQSQWSLRARRIEDMLPVCAELGVGVVAYSPQRGLFHPSQIDPVHAALSVPLADAARKHRATPAQIALAWVHQRTDAWGITVTPIPGTTRVPHLEENIAAAEITLDAEDLERLDAHLTVL